MDQTPINELWVLFKIKLFGKLYNDAISEGNRIIDEYKKVKSRENPFWK